MSKKLIQGKGCSPQMMDPKMMFENPKKIQVLNVPKVNPVERMLNKLTIHFQKKNNGGGEVLDVEYPTSVKDCAYITFEKQEDANNVLKREHILELNGEKYKLDVREAEEGHSDTDNEQVMQFVSTKLDTRPFDTRKAQQLIIRHGFKIVSYEEFIWEIKGSFPSLKKLRSDLMNLNPHQSSRTVTDLKHSANNKKRNTDGKSIQSRAFIDYRPQVASDESSDSSTTSEEDDCNAGEHTSNVESRSRVCSGKSNSFPLPLVSSPSSLPVTNSSNSEDTSPYTQGSISGLQGAMGYRGTYDQRKGAFSEMDNSSLNAYSSRSSTDPSASSHLSITVDKLFFKYLEACGMNDFHQVLEECSAGFEKSFIGDLCEIRLHPKQAAVSYHKSLSDAKSVVCAHIQKVQNQLRIYQIDLNVVKSCEKQKILSRCKLVSDLLTGVLLIEIDQTIHLIGSSAESYKALHYVLGTCAIPTTTGSSGPSQRGRR